MVRGAPTALTCFFAGFRTDFVTSVRVSVVSAAVLARAFGTQGPENPKGGAHPVRPLGYVPGRRWTSVKNYTVA